MKIISKFKDYYDYLQGIYGVDELLVYDRRVGLPVKADDPSVSKTPNEEDYKLNFHIAGQIHHIKYYKDQVFYSPEDIIRYHELKAKDAKKSLSSMTRWERERRTFIPTKKEALKTFKIDNGPTLINSITRQPVLIGLNISGRSCIITTEHNSSKSGSVGFKKYWGLPILEEFKLASVIPAEEMYKKISGFMGWLKDHPPLPDNQTNEGKIESHGFDKKISFRHRKE